MHWENAPMRLVTAKEGLLDFEFFPILPLFFRGVARGTGGHPDYLFSQSTVFPTTPALLQTRKIHANGTIHDFHLSYWPRPAIL